MNKMEHALHELAEMDALAAQDSPIHRLSPLAKLLTTIFYIIVTVSFHKYQLSGLAVMALIPVFLFQVSGIPVRTCFYKLRIVLPLVMAVGLFNPLFDRAPMFYLGSVPVSGGVVSMLSLMLKGVLCLMMSFLLIATTPIDSICAAEASRAESPRDAAAAHVPLCRRPDGRARHHDRRLSSARAGAEGRAHLCVGLVSRADAAAQHGSGAGAVFEHAAARL